MDAESLFGPIQSVPRALMGANGLPYKSNKSSTTTYLQNRYNNPPAIINTLPGGWVPDTVILEGMFLIQTPPLPTMSCMKEYVQLLLARFVRPHFVAGVMAVHVVFDCPSSLPETPKELEQRRRDTAVEPAKHNCSVFTDDMILPNKWRSVLDCRSCKKKLTTYIADEMLTLIQRFLHGNQQFVTNIDQEAFSVSFGATRSFCPSLRSNADEGDLRVWLHCMHSSKTRTLIYSRDTDVYHIGLTQVANMSHTDIIVQLNLE